LLINPYVSDFLKKTLVDNKIPVVNTKIAEGLNLYAGTKCLLLFTKKPNWSEVLKDKKGKIFSIRKY